MAKMNRKAGFDIQNYMIAFLVVCGILVTFGTMSVKMGNDYAPLHTTPINSSFSQTYNKLDSIVAVAEDQKNKINTADVGTEESTTQIFAGSLSAIKILIPSLSIFSTMINDAAVMIGIPAIWVTIAITSLFVLFTCAIIFMIFRPFRPG